MKQTAVILGLMCFAMGACAPRDSKTTDPILLIKTNKKSHDAPQHPALISKLRYVQDQSTSWILIPGFLRGDGEIPIKFDNTGARKNVAGATDPIQVGEIFFKEGSAQGRFKYLGHETRNQVNPAIDVEEIITVVRIEDQKPNKAGTIYELPAPLPRNRKPYIQHDRSAVLVLETPGQGEAQVVIEEFTHFSLPFGQEEKPYFLKSVTPKAIVVERLNGKGSEEVRIQKGSIPH